MNEGDLCDGEGITVDVGVAGEEVCSGEGDGLTCRSTVDGGGGAGECWSVVNGCDLKGQGDGISEIGEAERGEVLERQPPAGDVDLVLRVGGVGIDLEFRSAGSHRRQSAGRRRPKLPSWLWDCQEMTSRRRRGGDVWSVLFVVGACVDAEFSRGSAIGEKRWA